jgi:predicted amidohydrolase YtcJ
VRGIGYHESVAGRLDRHALDAVVADRPVRVQHASGIAWFLNSCALARVGLDGEGRLFGRDRWLRERLGAAVPDLAPVGRRLSALGVTGVTDATATNGATEAALVRAAGLPQHVVLMGGDECTGPRKVVLEEGDFPALEGVVEVMRAAHERGRVVAVHCVTRAALVLALAAFEAAGAHAGDRIEHASVAPPEAVDWVRRLGLTVVTQPNFVAERGDRYIADVDPEDRPWLYRVRGFLDAGVPVGGGTDAPFGDPDPWRAMRAAVERRTGGGAVIRQDEGVTPEQALALFTTRPEAPGGAPRRVAVGEPGDLCLLSAPWRVARNEMSSELVRMVVRDGSVIYAA